MILCALSGPSTPDAGALTKEVAPQRVPFVAVELAHECGVHRVGQQQRARRVEDGDRRRRQPVQHALNARGDERGHRALARCDQTRGAEQVLAFGAGDAQRPPQRLDDLFGRIGGAALLEAGDVVDRDARQLRQLLAPQPRRAAVTADRQSGRRGGDAVAPAPQRVPELRGRHDSTVHRHARSVLVLAVPGRRDVWLTVQYARIVEVMTTTLITGANKGIGFETARQLLAAGHTVYVGSRDPERGRRAAEELGARAIQLDVTDDASVDAAARTIQADGGLDVLVTNAAIEERGHANAVIGPIDVTADLVRKTFATNVFGTVRTLHAFLPLLQRSTHPVVVNVSSGLGSLSVVSSMPADVYPGVAYPASKAAVNMITVQYAKAFPGMRINAADPGFTKTDLNGNTGFQTVEQGAAIIVRLARVDSDGPTGGLFNADGTVPW
jgi:NAD(P)-dependent dehydrogenase (short-subunit alcohol dehydrogenase family)